MSALAELLAGDELLLLFLVIVTGLLLGRVQFRGVRLGLAGVLFAGLALSAGLAPPGKGLTIAHQLKEFGLILFVYCVGLTSGPGFFSAFRQRGLRLNVVVVAALSVGALVCAVGGRQFGLDRGQIAGVFCGSLTNTPALGAATDRLVGSALALQPVVGYSVTYPFGVFGALFSFRMFLRLLSRQLAGEQAAARERPGIRTHNLRVKRPSVIGRSIGELRVRDAAGVWISRLRREAQVSVPTKYTVLHEGDVVTVVGDQESVGRASGFFGESTEEKLETLRTQVDMRRVLVSSRAKVGRALSELDLDRQFNAQVTRIRRADIDFIPTPQTRLELGDRLRVVAPVDNLARVSAYFGDSERELAEVDYVALALGVALGLLVARVPLPLFGTKLELGAAGGPLLVALILGRVGRTGPLVWTVPYETNRVLRDVGLLLFLAGVGVSAGGRMASALGGQGLVMLLLGAIVTVATTGCLLGLARLWARAGVVASMGVASGMQTQPAMLEAAFELSGKSEETYVAYALVYPVAMIFKILLAQLLAIFA